MICSVLPASPVLPLPLSLRHDAVVLLENHAREALVRRVREAPAVAFAVAVAVAVAVHVRPRGSSSSSGGGGGVASRRPGGKGTRGRRSRCWFRSCRCCCCCCPLVAARIEIPCLARALFCDWCVYFPLLVSSETAAAVRSAIRASYFCAKKSQRERREERQKIYIAGAHLHHTFTHDMYHVRISAWLHSRTPQHVHCLVNTNVKEATVHNNGTHNIAAPYSKKIETAGEQESCVCGPGATPLSKMPQAFAPAKTPILSCTTAVRLFVIGDTTRKGKIFHHAVSTDGRVERNAFRCAKHYSTRSKLLTGSGYNTQFGKDKGDGACRTSPFPNLRTENGAAAL